MLQGSEEKKETLIEELNLTDDGTEGKKSKPGQADGGGDKKNDYTLLDALITNFVETPRDEMLSVLCGYFHKIISSILAKENQRFLEYLLIKRQGDLFGGLIMHLTHHSIAQLMIELLQI